MTVEEMEAEMRNYPCLEGEKYAFISYSHMDMERVYPEVLKWMRDGYNIYIDRDFEKHSSGDNWVELMQGKISNPNCVMIVIFRSKNSAFSYAALLELLTIHSPPVERVRLDNKVHLDIIELEPVPQDMDLKTPGVDEEAFKQHFEKLKVNLGETFAANNPSERKAMLKGLECFLSPKKEKFDFRWKGAADLLEVIDKRYAMGAGAFFSGIAFFSWHWMRHFSLSGNNKKLSHMTQRLQEEHVFCKETVSAPAQAPAPAQPRPVPAAAVSRPEPPASAGTDYCRADGKAGRVRQTGQREFLLLAGAYMRKSTVPSCPGKAVALRRDILARGLAEDAGAYYVLKDNVACTSLSLAASVLTGTSISGNAFWRPADASVSSPGAGGAAKAYTLRRIRELFETDEAFCRRVGKLRRTGLPAGGRGAMDVAMAAILGGCNSVKSPAQINYYKFAVADMSKKAPGDALGATWTWSSNCKKALGEAAASGKIDPRTDACYAALPEDATLGEIMDRFARSEPFFRTKKNDVVLTCLERFAQLLEKES